jgi:hypothetical protein
MAQVSVTQDLASDLIQRIQAHVAEAESAEKPLELDPFRSQLFELFVMADAAGFLDEGSEVDLTSDAIGRLLAQEWNLAEMTQKSLDSQSRLPSEHLSKMRMLWSFMRLWMEWSYAWQRWNEFHPE